MSKLYIGLMSGTSLDGVDAALVSFKQGKAELLATHYTPYPNDLFNAIQAACQLTSISFDDLGSLDVRLGNFYADCVLELLQRTDMKAEAITAIGSHGQTIQHSPYNETPYTLQIGDAHRLAERTDITVVADFRCRDMAAGGQGAPLVPAFHKAAFQTTQSDLAIINIGGIANITFLSKNANDPLIGFDCGPGCTLMDQWTQRHFDKKYDTSGNLARIGAINNELLNALLLDPYFESPYPKSTGPEYFSVAWLKEALDKHPTNPLDTLCTLLELTASCIATSLRQLPSADNVLLCGGGSHNNYLKERIAACTQKPIETTESYGVAPDWVEAMAFAWLAKQTVEGKTSNTPSVTGATKDVILGAIYPG